MTRAYGGIDKGVGATDAWVGKGEVGPANMKTEAEKPA